MSAWSNKQSLLPNQSTVRNIRRHLCSPKLAISELLKLSQRLRITIEEEGLVRLAPDDLPLTVTPDCLYTALSLMSECDLLSYNEEDGTFSAGRYAIGHPVSS